MKVCTCDLSAVISRMSHDDQLRRRIAEVIAVGTRIGHAIATDVIAEGMSKEWTGLDPQDVDQIPDGMDANAVECVARQAFMDALEASRLVN